MKSRVQMKINRDIGGYVKDKQSSDCTEAMVIKTVMFGRHQFDRRNKTAHTNKNVLGGRLTSSEVHTCNAVRERHLNLKWTAP